MRKTNNFKLWSSNQNPDEHTYQHSNGQVALKKADFFIIFHNNTLLCFLFLQLTEALPLEFD